MRRYALRAMVLAGALTALSVPVFSATQQASACSNPGCVVGVPIGGVPIDTFYSPITITASAAWFDETQLSGEPHPAAVSVPGGLTLSVADWRGNNQGWDAYISSSGVSGPNGNAFPASALAVTGVSAADTGCMGLYSPMCSSATANSGAIGATLDTSPVLAYACPVVGMGFGTHDVGANLSLNLSGTAAELFASPPASWYANFTVSVEEGTSAAFNSMCGAVS